MSSETSCTAFDGNRRIASGTLAVVAPQARELLRKQPQAQVLIFDDATGEVIDLSFREPPTEQQSAAGETRRPGRPKLGVVAREVTLLPRHWEWLATQPGGASVALRKLVEQGIGASAEADRTRRARESAYRFASAMAGNEPGFEEALRALFAGQRDRFHLLIQRWPADVRDHVKRLAADAFGAEKKG